MVLTGRIAGIAVIAAACLDVLIFFLPWFIRKDLEVATNAVVFAAIIAFGIAVWRLRRAWGWTAVAAGASGLLIQLVWWFLNRIPTHPAPGIPRVLFAIAYVLWLILVLCFGILMYRNQAASQVGATAKVPVGTPAAGAPPNPAWSAPTTAGPPAPGASAAPVDKPSPGWYRDPSGALGYRYSTGTCGLTTTVRPDSPSPRARRNTPVHSPSRRAPSPWVARH